MTQEKFTKLIEKKFDWFIQQGYKMHQIDTNIIFEKSFGDNTYALKFHWGEYHVIKIQGIIAYKGFRQVEEIIAETIQREPDYTIKKIWKGEVPKEFHAYANDNLLTNSIYISNELQVQQFSEFVKIFFENEANFFFKKYSDLKSIIEEMNLLPSDKKASMIVNNNNTAFLRIMAIKYYVDPVEGINFFDETVKELEPVKKQKVFNVIIQNLKTLKTKLTHPT